MQRWIGLVVGLLLWQGTVSAQDRPACFAQRQLVNSTNAGADVVVGAVAVQAVPQSTSRCQVMLRNNGTAPMRCLPSAQGTPTATSGLLMNAGDQLIMTTAGREAWACIRTTGSSTTATTIEEVP